MNLDSDSHQHEAVRKRKFEDLEAGKFSEAIPEMEKARVTDSLPFVDGWLGYACAAAGERAKAEADDQDDDHHSPGASRALNA